MSFDELSQAFAPRALFRQLSSARRLCRWYLDTTHSSSAAFVPRNRHRNPYGRGTLAGEGVGTGAGFMPPIPLKLPERLPRPALKKELLFGEGGSLLLLPLGGVGLGEDE